MCATLEADSRLCVSPRSRPEDPVMRRSIGCLLLWTASVGAAATFGQAPPVARRGDPTAPPARAIRRVLPNEPADALAAIRVLDDFIIAPIAQEPLVNS